MHTKFCTIFIKFTYPDDPYFPRFAFRVVCYVVLLRKMTETNTALQNAILVVIYLWNVLCLQMEIFLTASLAKLNLGSKSWIFSVASSLVCTTEISFADSPVAAEVLVSGYAASSYWSGILHPMAEIVIMLQARPLQTKVYTHFASM